MLGLTNKEKVKNKTMPNTIIELHYIVFIIKGLV